MFVGVLFTTAGPNEQMTLEEWKAVDVLLTAVEAERPGAIEEIAERLRRPGVAQGVWRFDEQTARRVERMRPWLSYWLSSRVP